MSGIKSVSSGNARENAVELARMIKEGKGENVVVLDVSGKSTFADYFIIATASSSVHLRGLGRIVSEGIVSLGIKPVPVRQNNSSSDEWRLIDLGDIVIHLMTAPARTFYDLEKLWFGAEVITP